MVFKVRHADGFQTNNKIGQQKGQQTILIIPKMFLFI